MKTKLTAIVLCLYLAAFAIWENIKSPVTGAITTEFHSVRMFIQSPDSTGGGHIGLGGKSLCGVESRFPYMESEYGVAEDDTTFSQWMRTNETWICRTCLKSHKRLTARTPPARKDLR